MRYLIVIAGLAAACGAAAQDMKPNKEPVPSPSDLATEVPRLDGDLAAPHR